MKGLSLKLKALGYEVFESNPTTTEIGLTRRATAANNIKKDKKVFISIHANAAGNGID
ncbi:MAG: hypothetical protein ACOH2V_00135 [Candidatus Saccharimonadaceae bacterium]